MPRGMAKAATPVKPNEPEKSTDSDERVDFNEENDEEEMMDEEVEYEEIEVEEEVEETEEEEEVDEDEANVANRVDIEKGSSGSDTKFKDDDEREKHAKLLALPPHGSEVYIGGIPQEVSEEDLKEFCKVAGEVAEVRFVKGKDSKENKGFVFVSFRSVEIASKAIEKLNNTEFKGKRIKCSTSQAKHKLFIGNIPRSWGDEDLKKTVTEIGPGVSSVELVKDMKNRSNNRGFAFIEYYNNACAEYSRQKMMNPKFKLDDNAPTVSWADNKNTHSESSTASQVKAVYVKNLPKDITQDQLRKLFEHHGTITRVNLPPSKSGKEMNRIGFVHFEDRSSAMKALKNTEKYELDGQVLECSLAKQQAEQKSGGGSNPQTSGLLSTYPTHAGYSLLGDAYSAFGAGNGAAGLAQPLIYGRGQNPAGMAMMPMLLPDGRIGYVLQQPGLIQHIPQHRGGGSSSRVRYGNDSGQWRKYRPY